MKDRVVWYPMRHAPHLTVITTQILTVLTMTLLLCLGWSLITQPRHWEQPQWREDSPMTLQARTASWVFPSAKRASINTR